MAIVSYNSNTYADPVSGQGMIYPKPPTAINGLLGNQLGSSSSSLTPPQVIGLVPLFSCCAGGKDAVGGFTYSIPDCGGGIVLSITVGSTSFGNFTTHFADSAATIQANINAILTGGWTCTVLKVGLIVTVTLNAPVGSGTTYNNAVINIGQVSTCNASGHLITTTKIMSGGQSSGSAPCDPNCDCREGKYMADYISDDRKFTLPVFATPTCSDSYHNDTNTWLLSYAGSYDAISNGDFKLQQLSGTTWSSIATLNNTTYGTPYNNNFFTANCSPSGSFSAGKCQNVNYCGYSLSWQAVLSAFGEGTYRFYVSGQYSGGASSYCFYSPPFCLKTWDCNLCDGTVKFEAYYSGGNFGSVTTQGQSWSMCCSQSATNPNGTSTSCTNPINWYDSIRFYGFFGYETAEYARDFIKYATGEIKKIRDEAIKSFSMKSSQMPSWFHERFYAYALMADQLYVSDYNLNNANYNYKFLYIIADSSYAPKYTNYSRYNKVNDIKFKEGVQYVFRDRCC